MCATGGQFSAEPFSPRDDVRGVRYDPRVPSHSREKETRSAITLRGDAAESPRLHSFADDFARQTQLSAGDRGRVLIILDELFSNIVRHGYDANGPSGTIEIVLALEDGKLRIELIDDGRPFDPLSAAPPNLDLPPAQRPVGGLGIHIIRNLVDEAHYARKGGHNYLTLFREIDPRL
jgi:serine/threonine-protein kinase RsbW